MSTIPPRSGLVRVIFIVSSRCFMGNPVQSPTPEPFASTLRMRTEEALSASVHHASLAQQYLALAQKFSALAAQAEGNPDAVMKSLQQLETEAATGRPAGPIGVSQSPFPLAHVPIPVMEARADVPGSAEEALASPLATPTPLFSPPARFAASEATKQTSLHSRPETLQVRALGSSEAGCKANNHPDSVLPAATQIRTNAGRPAITQRKRSRHITLRKLLERARLVTLETSERVRVRARKADLKPQLRSAGEEIKQELKRGRGPAAISSIVTALALFLLTLAQLEIVEDVALPPLVAGFSEKIEPVEESLPIEPPAAEAGEQLDIPVEELVEEMVEDPEPEEEPLPEPMIVPVPEVEIAESALPETPEGIASTNVTTTGSPAVETRSAEGRKKMIEKYGGSVASESAVGFALEWLASRQRADGTWDFIDVGPCANPGTVNNPIGGTAYALLPFLAAGQTHKEGQYQKQVLSGLQFLTTVGVRLPAGYDLRGVINKSDEDEDPNYAYYVHGAATLALCEAYGMTQDRKLKPFAEEAVKFLVSSQDPRGGGWRYNPQQAGSTSGTAIQVMALKAAEKAGLRIPDQTWKGASWYFDSVSVDREGRYGYEAVKKTYGVSVTSMAALSRMYLGWGRDDGDLRAAVSLIDRRGPYDNLYYNYFATQVMKNWGGPEWDRWNARLRDDLIIWQETEGVAKGSWNPRDRDDYSKAGGRLLTTCLATLTLEVYYRYTPLLAEASDPDTSMSAVNADLPLPVNPGAVENAQKR